jgi:hypothetical protein
MSAATASRSATVSSLDNLTLSRKEGWRDYVEAPKRVRPEALSDSVPRSGGLRTWLGLRTVINESC